MDSTGDDPFSSPVARIASTLRAKRDATSAQLADPSTSTFRIRQKAHEFSAQMEKAALERRLLAAEAERKDLETKLIQKDRMISKLENDRRWLADREKEEREEKEQERKEHEEEKKQTTATIRSLRIELSTLRDEVAEHQEAHTSLKRSTTQTINSQKGQILDLMRQAAEFQDEVAIAKTLAEAHENTVQELRIQLEEQMQKNAQEAASISGEISTPNSREDWQIVRDELHRQASYTHQLESTNARLQGELASLKERQVHIAVLQEEKRDLERKVRVADAWREQIAVLEAELDAARVERVRWTDAARQTAGASHELTEMRMTHAMAQEEIGVLKAIVKTRDTELEEARKSLEVAKARAAEVESDVWELRAQGLRRDARLELAEREIGFLKALVKSFDAEEKREREKTVDSKVKEEESKIISEKEEARNAVMQNLEAMMEWLKTENERLEREIMQLGKMRPISNLADIAKRLEESQGRVNELEKELTALRAANDKAALTIDNLEQTLFELRGDIATGTHIPPETRVLCLRDNPLQQWADFRQEVVDRLKRENAALLDRLSELEASGVRAENAAVGGLVPRESWEKERKEKEELEEVVKQKEKRLLRLQQVFSSKAQEFRETMSSILGYKFHFFSNGQVRVTSQYDLNTSFTFCPISPTQNPTKGEDEDGMKMQLVTTSDSSLPDLARTVDYWVNTRVCIPGLMASVTLECYERTEKGQRQAWGPGSR